ncbi:MAG: hypothetical protein ACK4MD_10210, partial [Demequina sp.]
MTDDRRRAPGGPSAGQRRTSPQAPRSGAGGATRRPATARVRATQSRAGAPRVGNPAVRQRIVTLATLAILLVFAFRLVTIQGVNAAELSSAALENRLATSTIEPVRADIVDRSGVVMATSAQRYHVFVNQQRLKEFKRSENGQLVAEGPLDAARILAPILGVSESELAADLVGERTFQYIAKYVTPETWSLINAERIAGIDREPVTERMYPNGDVGGNVVGFVGGREDKQGVNWGLA